MQIDDYATAPAAVRIASAHAGTLVIHLSSPRRDSVMRSDNRAPHETSARANIRVEHDYRELKTGLGLDHFEGRSYLGWHRHVTLAVLAQAFITMIRTGPKVPAPG